MKLLVTGQHGIERTCPECQELRVVWIGEDEETRERLTCCTRCQTVIHRESIDVPFTTAPSTNAADPSALPDGVTVRWT